TVEMDRFASLRPPSYGGAMVAGQIGAGQQGVGGLGVAGLGALGGGLGALGVGGGFGGLPANANPVGNTFNNRYQLGQLGGFGQQGGNLGWMMNQNNNDATANTLMNGTNFSQNRLTYEELQQRRKNLNEAKEKAAKVGSAVAALDPA